MNNQKQFKHYDYYGESREEMINYLSPQMRVVLDVGCAKGYFGRLAKTQLGVSVWGIEINPDAANIASKYLDKVICKNICDAINDLPLSYFDCIVFNDVLEHIIDPYGLLGFIKRLLTPDGVIVASIPNIRHAPVLYELVVRGNWDYRDLGVLDKTHLRFFTKKSIKKMFEDQGYDVLKMDGINRSESFRGKFISKLLIGPVSDMRYIQFACLAKPIKD
jgi:2-polyprenyl-3-methyl-5-hydroxy-6-metoxy-1,4-benzoquinol methylase